jgi:hypothetical protein
VYFRHVPTHCKFIALMPQWDFLNIKMTRALGGRGSATNDPPADKIFYAVNCNAPGGIMLASWLTASVIPRHVWPWQSFVRAEFVDAHYRAAGGARWCRARTLGGNIGGKFSSGPVLGDQLGPHLLDSVVLLNHYVLAAAY